MRDEMEDKYLRACEGDDYLGVQCYTKMVVGPDGVVFDPPGEKTEMGYLSGPNASSRPCVERPRSHRYPSTSPRTGSGPTTTTSAFATDRCSTGSAPRARRRRGRTRLLPVVAARQLRVVLATAPKFGIVSVDRTTFVRTPKPSAQWYATTTRDFPRSVLDT